MIRNRLFNILIAIVLVITIALTAREAFATADVMSGRHAENPGASTCATLPLQMAIHTEYVSKRGMWITYTNQGPAGVDGGLMDLLPTYRTCSR
jgi:hypothetical protein